MADNPSIRAPGDKLRININQDYEVRYWSEKLGISADELREVVTEVGPMADAVEKHVHGRSGKRRGNA